MRRVLALVSPLGARRGLRAARFAAGSNVAARPRPRRSARRTCSRRGPRPRPRLRPGQPALRPPTSGAHDARLRPSPTPVPTIKGILVKASEPLLGFLVDDRLDSPDHRRDLQVPRVFAARLLSAPTASLPGAVHAPRHGRQLHRVDATRSCPKQIDRLIAAGEVQPMIVVMPDDGESTYYANWTDDGPRWGDYLTDDVVSTIDERYRTLPERPAAAIGGLSMGGLGALNLAFQHPDVFGVVGAHSPSVRLEPDPTLWFLRATTSGTTTRSGWLSISSGLESLKIWLDAGTEDVWLPNIEAVHDAHGPDRGCSSMWHVFPGPHEAEYWIEHVPDYLHFYGGALRSKRNPATPLRHSGTWLHILAAPRCPARSAPACRPCRLAALLRVSTASADAAASPARSRPGPARRSARCSSARRVRGAHPAAAPGAASCCTAWAAMAKNFRAICSNRPTTTAGSSSHRRSTTATGPTRSVVAREDPLLISALIDYLDQLPAAHRVARSAAWCWCSATRAARSWRIASPNSDQTGSWRSRRSRRAPTPCR